MIRRNSFLQILSQIKKTYFQVAVSLALLGAAVAEPGYYSHGYGHGYGGYGHHGYGHGKREAEAEAVAEADAEPGYYSLLVGSNRSKCIELQLRVDNN